MRGMRQRVPLPVLGSALTVLLLAAGCTHVTQAQDKAGGAGEPVVLTMANTNGDIAGYTPAVSYFVHRVEEISGGDLRIQVLDKYGRFADDAEQKVVRDTAADKVDVGWVGSRVFDTTGVSTMQALSAPMLIDSYALEDAVIHSGIVKPMLSSLDDIGIVGLGVVADGLHKPMAVRKPIVGPRDWRGIKFGIFTSNGQAAAIDALDATPVEVTASTRDQAAADGTIQGFEQELLHTRGKALYVTLNVTLWPQMDVLIANPDAFDSLNDDQRAWLQQAAEDAADASARIADTDQQSVREECEAGGRFSNATPQQLAALKRSLSRVYTTFEADPRTKAFIQEIQRLKDSTQPDPQLDIPRGCTGGHTEHATGPDSGIAPPYLNGVYRWTITKQEAATAGAADDPDYPATTTFWLKDGTYRGSGDGTNHGTYWVTGNRITFHALVYHTTETFTFKRSTSGDLSLTPVLPMNTGDAVLMSTMPWTKIG
jgi:TRAP-type C4-dicarboxylate transport system substrate-binding protein